MGILNFLGKKQSKEAAELPPPPPPPGKGLDLELPEAPGLPPLPPANPSPMPTPQPIPITASSPPAMTPSIPSVSGQTAVAHDEPTVMIQPPMDAVEEHHDFPEMPELPELGEPVIMEPTVSTPNRIVGPSTVKPMFVSIEDYQDILQSITTIKEALHDTEVAMNRLNELKNSQERLLEDWRSHIEDAERKVTYIDQVIFRGE